MSVRAKFIVQSITEHSYSKEARTVKLCAVYSNNPDNKEDCHFAKYTPSGSIEMLIDNPPAAEQFKNGQTFYVTFTPVPADDQK